MKTTKPKTRLDKYRADIFDVPVGMWESSDNGQMACEKHVPMYGRIPWKKMTDAAIAAMHTELADIKPLDESLCEICSRDARNARAKTVRAPAAGGDYVPYE